MLLPSHSSDSSSPRYPFAIEEIERLESPEGMERIAHLQLARIERMMNEEQETGIKHTSLSRELQALSTIMKCQMKLKEWHIMNEGNDPVKRRRLERMKRRFEKPFGAILESIGEEGRNRLLEASSKLLEDLERHAVEGEIGPDGKLRLVKPNDTQQ